MMTRRTLRRALLALALSISMAAAFAASSKYHLIDRKDFAPGTAVQVESVPAAKNLAKRDGGVVIDATHPALTINLPVVAPGKTVAVIVRARALDGNPFNWVDVTVGDRTVGRIYPCIDKYVNMKVLVENAPQSTMALTLSLKEGPGCIVDYVRPYDADKAYAIHRLAPADSKPTVAPTKPFAPTAAFRNAARTSTRWLFGQERGAGMSGIRGTIKRCNAWTPDAEAWQMMIGRVISFFETPELLARQPSKISFETRHPIQYWDTFEARDDLTDAWRLETVNTLFLLARESLVDWSAYNISRYYRSASTLYPQDGKIVNFGRNPYRFQRAAEIPPILEKAKQYNKKHPFLAHNHMLWPALSIDAAGDYFARYNRPEAPIWHAGARYTHGQMLPSAKPYEDCSGYQIHAMNLVIEYAEKYDARDFFLQGGPLYRFFDLLIASTNNLGDGPGYGDTGGYPYTLNCQQGVKTTAFDAVISQATNVHDGFRRILKNKNPDKYLGLYVCPLEPMWYAFCKDRRPKDTAIPPQQQFDKLTFRGGWGANDQYLILDGLTMGYHNHMDGNSILQFDDEAHTWLVERGYHHKGARDAYQHNMVTVDRPDAPGGKWPRAPIPFASALVDSSREGDVMMTRTVSTDTNGTDWNRQIFWRKEKYFVVVDTVTARRDGPVEITCRWRTLGDVRLSGRRFVSVQKPKPGSAVKDPREMAFVLVNCDDSKLSLTKGTEPAGIFAKYPYADPTVQVLEETYSTTLRRGESRRFVNAFAVVEAGKASDRKAFDAKVNSDGSVQVNRVDGKGGQGMTTWPWTPER